MSKILLRYTQIKAVLVICFFKILSSIFGKGVESYWVLCERGKEARDNGYCFYKYLKDNYPEKKIFYIIDDKSADYEKVKEDAMNPRSLKCYWKLVRCEKIISTHYPPQFVFGGTRTYNFCFPNKNFYFLQHGVIGADLQCLYKNNISVRLFVCGAKPEYDDILSRYGHPDGVVQYTGLARYDYLHNNKVEKQILIMPTWRSYLRHEKDFCNSEYYKKWQAVLLNKELIDMLEKENVRLVFYPHFEMQKNLHLFKTESKNVILASFDKYDVQALLKESALLITDYSSVFFDFAYMKKPVIYFQFDQERFFGEHYEGGYFKFDTMGFGKVIKCEKLLCQGIISVIERGFQLEQIYKERIDSFFPLYDTKNCERIYNCIINDKN